MSQIIMLRVVPTITIVPTAQERHWLEWKRDGCAAFDRAATEAESAPLAAGGAKKRRSGAAARAGGKRQQLGNSELSRLWNLGARLARGRLVPRRGQCEGGGGRCE